MQATWQLLGVFIDPIKNLRGCAKSRCFARASAALLWRTLLVLQLLLAAGLVQAQPLLLTELPTGPLGAWTELLVEDGPPLSLEAAQARQREGLFHQGTQPVLTYGIGARPVWVHLELFNPGAESLPFQMVAGTTWIDRLDLFVVHDNRVSASWQTGDAYPNAHGLVPAVGFTFAPSFPPGRSDLYLRVATDDPLALPIELMTQEQALANERLVHYSYGFFYGFLFALMAYNGMLFAGLRERSHLYYSLYLASMMLLNLAYTGHGGAWLWPGYPQLQRYVILVLMVLTGCSGLLFASRFLALAQHAPRVLRLVRLCVVSGLGLMALCILIGNQAGAALVAFSFIALFTLGMVLLGILTVRNGRMAGRYFLGAVLFGMFGAASTTFAVWGWLPFNSVTYHGLEYGLIVEATLLALALAHHFNKVAARLARVTVSHDELSREVAERKQAEAALLVATRAVEAASRAKSEFLASMSHELRTPLNAILGFSQLFSMDQNLPEDAREHSRQIERAGKHLLSLVNDLMDLSRIEAGKLVLSMEPVAVGPVIEESLELIVPIARQQGIAINQESGDGETATVCADYVRLRQVVINLLSNAIKYNRPQGTVSLSCRIDQGKVRISVADTGRGIPADRQSRIFSAFDRLGAEGGNIEGTGIGLVITKRIVEAMGGSIGFASTEGQGSTFWVELTAGKPLDPVSEASAFPAGIPEIRSQPGVRPVVLYIEDNPINLSLMQQIFKGKDMELRDAHTAEIGIDLARAEPPALILMDINLPGMDGYAALKLLQADVRTAHIPVAAVSANAMAGDVKQGLDAGFVAYFTKPVDTSSLHDALRRLIVKPVVK